MGDKSAIEWTDATWNPIIGCSRVSEGCRNCYAERTAIRQAKLGERYWDLVKSTPAGPRWTGEVRLVESALDAPLRWKRPRRIFVNSMGDLFHESVPDEWLDNVWRVMKAGALMGHTFQILTKRPERMAPALRRLAERLYTNSGALIDPRVWLGVSVEDQATADERIPLLLQTPAAVRWVSYEPALGPVDFVKYLGERRERIGNGIKWRSRGLDWLVVGGESGPGARPFDLAWARSTIKQCRAAGVPVFVKQMGAKPISGDNYDFPSAHHFGFVDRKGGDPQDWPEDLRVREYPR